MTASDRDRLRILDLERMNADLEGDRDYYAQQYAHTQQVARQGALRLSELKPGLQKALGEIESLRTRISELELALGTAKRDGWREAFLTLDPVFRRIESALHCSSGSDFQSLMEAAIEEYGKLAPDFVLDERDYLTAAETAKRLRVGRDRLRDIPRSDLDYVVRGEGGRKEHRRYAKADVLKYSARLVRGKGGRNE